MTAPDAGSERRLVTAQVEALASGGWQRVRACGSRVIQFEDRNRQVEVFVMPGRALLRRDEAGARATGDTDSEDLRALRAAVSASKPVIGLSIAGAGPAPPC